MSSRQRIRVLSQRGLKEEFLSVDNVANLSTRISSAARWRPIVRDHRSSSSTTSDSAILGRTVISTVPRSCSDRDLHGSDGGRVPIIYDPAATAAQFAPRFGYTNSAAAWIRALALLERYPCPPRLRSHNSRTASEIDNQDQWDAARSQLLVEPRSVVWSHLAIRDGSYP